MAEMIELSGVELEVVQRGSGRPLLFLHAGEGLQPERPWLDQLAEHFRVIAPAHPGWGASALPDWMGSVDDLAYLYLDLAEKLDLRDAVLVGSCFGGWVAAEMAVRNTSAFDKIVLAAPLGIKVSGREVRDIADMHSMTREDFAAHAWADPAREQFDPAAMSDAALKALVQGREALALFGWKPYMHNPRLKHWLHRIDKPVKLLWGAKDRIVTPEYGAAWQAAIPAAELTAIEDCGHFPAWEQPATFVRHIVDFAG